MSAPAGPAPALQTAVRRILRAQPPTRRLARPPFDAQPGRRGSLGRGGRFGRATRTDLG
jgi:hypothetical protein